MAKIPIQKVGGAVDTTDLTAVPGDVLSPELFIGSGSDEGQRGIVPLRGGPTYSLPINGTQTLQPGYYSEGKISQSIPTMAGQSIGPGAQMITIPTAGKYMTSNIVIRTTKNLIPSVIKKGTTVGGVTGTFEGYVITDPNTLYKYGTFNGIQSLTVFKYKLYDNVGVVGLEKDHINVYVRNNTYYTAIVFNEPIDLTGLNRLIVRAEFSQSASASISLYRNKVTNYFWDNENSTNLKINPDIGDQVAGMLTSGNGGDFTLDVSSKSGKAYLYLFFTSPASTSKIQIVKFE